jgi:hypothetical protein
VPPCLRGEPFLRLLGLIFLGLASAGLYWSFARRARGLPSALARWDAGQELIVSLLLHAALVGILGAAAALLVWRARAGAWVLLPIVGAFALAFRLLLVGAPQHLSSDVHRYVWDGRVQAAGINPYRYAPADPALAGLRDAAIYPHINRPTAPTLYPPGAQLLFRAIYAAWPDSLVALQAATIGSDGLTFGLLVAALSAAGLPLARAILFAWHPLVVVEFAVSAHADAFVLPWLLGALLLAVGGRPAWAGVALGVATLTKLVPALLLPALWARGGWRLVGAWAATVAAGYAVYADAGLAVLGYLPRYLTDPGETFNPLVSGLITGAASLILPGPAPALVAGGVGLAALAALAMWILRRAPRDLVGIAGACLALLAVQLLFSRTVHAWYLTALVPLLCLLPEAGLLWLTAAVPLSYLKYLDPIGRMPAWVTAAELFPALALFLLTWRLAPKPFFAIATSPKLH